MKLIRYSFHDEVHAGVVTAAGVVPVPAINLYTGSKVLLIGLAQQRWCSQV